MRKWIDGDGKVSERRGFGDASRPEALLVGGCRWAAVVGLSVKTADARRRGPGECGLPTDAIQGLYYCSGCERSVGKDPVSG